MIIDNKLYAYNPDLKITHELICYVIKYRFRLVGEYTMKRCQRTGAVFPLIHVALRPAYPVSQSLCHRGNTNRSNNEQNKRNGYLIKGVL